MILDLVRYDSPIIHSPAAKFDFNDPPMDPAQLAGNLGETLAAHEALGLAGPQVGIGYRVLAIGSNPIGVMFNPRIVDASETSQELEEGCLTYPGLILRVKRSRIIKVRYTLPSGETLTKQFTDLTARVIQHEIDHLDGVTMIDKQVGLKRDVAKRKWDKLVRRNGPMPASMTNKITPDVVSRAEMQHNIERTVNNV